MEATTKYPLNPLAACFVPLGIKAHAGNITGDLNSIKLRKSTPIYKLKYESPLTTKNRTDLSTVKSLDLISKTCENICSTSTCSEVNALVYARVKPEKLISDEASTDRSEDGTSTEKTDLMEQMAMTGTSSMELERTSNMDYENTDPCEMERKSEMEENWDSIKMIRIPNVANEKTDSDTLQAENLHITLERGEKPTDYEWKPERHASISSTESIQSTKSYQSDYGTDLDNIETEDYSDLPTEIGTNFKSPETIESWRETSELVPGISKSERNLQTKNSGTLSLYLAALLSSVFPSKNTKAKACSKETLKFESKSTEDCSCPPMFGWVIPFECFGNPLNLTGSCKKNYVHTTYQHAIYDHKDGVPTTYRKSLDFENYSFDSGHCSDEDEPSSSIEINTLEQCSSELESIIKDVFDCVDKSLSSCEDEKLDKADKNREVWITDNEMEVFPVKDSPIIDDGYHPLLEGTSSEDEVNIGTSVIEEFLNEALMFEDKNLIERYSSQSSCTLPCSVWCTKVPPPAIDMYKRFVKKMDSDPVNCNVADKKASKKQIYKRCFSANDTPKDFRGQVLKLTPSWEPAEFYQTEYVAFKESRETADNFMSSNFLSGQQTNPLKKGSDKWSLYDEADSLWQPLPDCVLSSDHNQKYAYKRARIMRRQKSVG